mgnify:CR=1 FL=1
MPADLAVIGGGYVGLVTAACFAELGHNVTCAESDRAKLQSLLGGRVPIYEPGLEELVEKGRRSGRLRFVGSAAEAAADAEFVFICVQTPPGPSGAADLKYVRAAAAEIGAVLSPRSVVVNKSTMPVGSTEVVRQVCEEAGAFQVHYVSNPEFLREGSAVYDFMHPDRIVIGSDETEAAIRVSELYKALNAPLLITDAASAELIKYASNAYLAMRISFVNSLARLCDAVGANVSEVTLGMGYDRRIGFEFLKPGPGFGGSCFPKDTLALAAIAKEEGVDFPLLDATLQTNESQISYVARIILETIGLPFPSTKVSGEGDVLDDTDTSQEKKVAVFGLSFKANTDDVRESPALAIASELIDAGVRVVGVDPKAAEKAKAVLPTLEIEGDPAAAASGADCIAILTEWDEFRWLDYKAIGKSMRRQAIVDARNILDPAAMKRIGFEYRGIGR